MSINLFICDEKYSQYTYLEFKDFTTSHQCTSQLTKYKKTSLNYSLAFIPALYLIYFLQGTITIYQFLGVSMIVSLVYTLNQHDISILLLSSILTLTLGLSENSTYDINPLINLPSFLIRKGYIRSLQTQ